MTVRQTRAFLATMVALFVGAVIATVSVVNATSADAAAKSIVGAWYVDTTGAPFEPHGIAFHADGIIDLTNPDAAEATNSSSAGFGAWQQEKKGAIRGSFFEVNADKTTFKYTTTLVVRFTVTVDGDRFTGPATATYYDGDRNVVAGPFPAELKGQRFGVDGPVPDPLNS